jgi:CheY-like chemotaxis protein
MFPSSDFNSRTILLVDDNEDDVFIMQSVFQKLQIPNPIQTLTDGDDAIAYLNGDGRYSDRTRYPLPTVVLLDLNMPRRNGFEVLAWIRAQPALKSLTVYILSASMRQVDVEQALALGANWYLIKPSQLEALMDLMAAWHCVARHSGFAVPGQRPEPSLVEN